MDDSFNNVLEGTRQYFMGLPKQARDATGQQMWPAGASNEEGSPAMSGVPAVSSRPSSAAAGLSSTPTPTPIIAPPRPPSEPLEPEPHIIHKATVMREAAEKRREQPEIEDEEEPIGALSPPSHIIRKPTPHVLPSPAPAPIVPSPSPVRPPSAALPPSDAPEQIEVSTQYRSSVHRVQTPTIRPPENYTAGRQPDPYSASRPPESFTRYQYETSSIDNGRLSHGSSIASPQPSIPTRQSPQTYARMSSSMPQHSSRLNEVPVHNSAVLHYPIQATQPPPPHNDRVPPIHHPPAIPQTICQAMPSSKRLATLENRSAHTYPRRESYSSARSSFERSQTLSQRKYDPQQAYSGYRPSTPQLNSNLRIEKHHQVQYKHGVMDTMSAHYATRPPDRVAIASQPHDHARIPLRPEYPNKSSKLDLKSGYNYAMPSTSAVRYIPSVPVQSTQNNSANQTRPTYRLPVPSKYNYDYATPNQVQTSPSRATVKSTCQTQQQRMTVSVTSLVNEMNLTKQKRESPLDLSVKTVKNSADSSTTQDDAIDSVSMKNETLLHSRSSTHSRSILSAAGYAASHKVDFAPDFAQYRERINHGYSSSPQPSHLPVRHNEAYESTRPVTEYPIESRHQTYSERTKYPIAPNKNEYVPRIDLTRPNGDDRFSESRLRDDRHIIIEERKRLGSHVASNIPEKILRYETWTADSRIERLSQSAREQRELMSRPVYDYTSHKRFQAYQNDKRPYVTSAYREHTHHSPRIPSGAYSMEPSNRDIHDYHTHYHDRISSSSSRHIIQKIPNHRDIHPHLVDSQSGVQPADKKVLSILRNSLETKQTSFSESTKLGKQIPDLIVIDDVDDSIIEITDLTKDNDIEAGFKTEIIRNRQVTPTLGQHIQMPKAVDSIAQDDSQIENIDHKRKSPENDVAARIRTKAELKVMPPSQDNSGKHDTFVQNEKAKLLPKSQKQHLFNQIREDNLRLESVIKNENISDEIPNIKSEPMCIEEIEKDAILPIKPKTEDSINIDCSESTTNSNELDLDWANACDSFMEQLKTGCHKKKALRKRCDTFGADNENTVAVVNMAEPRSNSPLPPSNLDNAAGDLPFAVTIKQEPVDIEENTSSLENHNKTNSTPEISKKSKHENKTERTKNDKKLDKQNNKINKNKSNSKIPNKCIEKTEPLPIPPVSIKKEVEEIEPIKAIVKEESESTDDDEPLIKSKILKEKEQSERLNAEMKYQLLKDLSEKSAYVKLECCDERVNINNRKSIDSVSAEKDDKLNKSKLGRQSSKSKIRPENIKNEKEKSVSSDSDDALSVASRLRVRKNIKTEDSKPTTLQKTPVKSPSKKGDSSSSCSTPMRKPGFGDGSDFHPGWEEELYRYKRSLRMPTRLIAIPRGRSGGPFTKNCSSQLTRGSTSLPDLDSVPLSPAPSSAPSIATDDLCRRPDKLTLDSDLESNSSSSVPNRLQYDSEASSSTIFSASKPKSETKSIVDVLIQKCGKRNDSKKRSRDREEKTLKTIPKNTNDSELLPTPSLGLLKNGSKGSLSAKKEKLMEDIFYLGAFRKETVAMFRNAFIKNTNGLIGATEEFAPVVLKSRTRTESRVLKQRATIKEVFGDDRPASAPPTSCREDFNQEEEDEQDVILKKKTEIKQRFKTKTKTKMLRRSSSIRDGLRSTKSLKRNDAKGRLMRLKKRNSLLKSFASKRMKEISNNKIKKGSSPSSEDKNTAKNDTNVPGTTEGNTKKRLKRLFGRRKFSSGFDYIRKKKKIIRREDGTQKIRRVAPKPTPESVHDIQKEIKGWFINKSIGETHLHRAARLGFTDCVAYCLEKMEADPSAKDNAGFTPLHVASAKGHVRIAKLLLQYGANVSAAAQGGIRPLHEACENSHVELVRLLLAYGADPLLGTYAGQTPEELAEGPAANLLRLHIADVQGQAVEPWRFPPPCEIIDREELGCDPLSSPPPASPPPPPDSMIELQCTETPLPPFYSLRTATGQPADGLWVLLQDITNILQIKSKESLLKQIHCGSGSPKELLREIRTQEFLERAQCHQLLGAGEKVNVRASKVALIRVTDKLRQLLKIETVLVS